MSSLQKQPAAGTSPVGAVEPRRPARESAAGLLLCQPGYETFLVKELAISTTGALESGSGWVRASRSAPAEGDLAFAHRILIDPVEISGDSVNKLAAAIADFFLASLRGERIEGTWPCVWDGPGARVGLGRRVSAAEAAFHEILKKRLSRVERLAAPGLASLPPLGPARGLFVWFTDFSQAWLARDAWLNGPKRMADDPLAPSRSYLKVEEAYGLLGREPAPGEIVFDLGAAPGGWSYSAAKRGARVTAVDNGPLKGGALAHPSIEHVRADAFGFFPPQGQRADWMFCDLVEEPHHVLEHLVRPWLSRAACRRFVVNLKFGRVDPLQLLQHLRAPASPLSAARFYRIRHLYHDREEFTVVGEMP